MIRKYKQTIFFVAVTIVMVVMIWFGVNNNARFEQNRVEGVSFIPARVVEVVEDRTSFNAAGARVGSQDLLVRLLSGPRRGESILVGNMLFPIEQAVYAREGTRVLIYFEHLPDSADDEYFARVQSYDRSIGLYIVILLFFVLLWAVFGKTGLRSAFSLIFTFVTIIFLLLPLITNGASSAPVTIILAILIIVVSLISIMGFGKKTLVSIIGSTIGILCYIMFYFLISAILRITGFNVQEIDLLIVAGFSMGVNELLFCGILIASLGALMDVAVSLASVTAELSEKDKNADFKELFRSGMKIGRDIIGSSSNTLILAFTGTFLITLILFRVNHLQYNLMINRVDIAIEVLRAISASAAMVLCAPVTAFVGSRIYASGATKSISSKKRAKMKK
ncbi:MAG: YibE/F family protein [Oscillospiraceae bacterium]|nr:YibE/F family protein [Oscillospiraceae bacterium]